MKIDLPDKYHKLEVGDKIKINRKIYTIKEKILYKSPNEFESKITRYKLSNGLFLEYDWGWSFFRLETKSNILGIVTTKSNYIGIKSISMVK